MTVTVFTDFGVTANELAGIGGQDVFMDRLITAAEEHRKARLEDGGRLWVARLIDMSAPDYDGYKFRFVSEIA